MAFTVPGYRVERLLGVGSQAEVWLGRHLATDEPVALKRVAAGSSAAVAAGRAEAALLAVLDHPNLIALRACLPLETALVLVLELAEAGTLAALLARRRRLTPPEVVAAISPIAAALAHAHDAGLLHGDVSAANILFSRVGRPKLADLGVARLLATIAGSQATVAGSRTAVAGSQATSERLGVGAVGAASSEALGTPAYLDPTIAAGGAAGLASDVFSLGAVALHALTGAGPWQTPGEPAPGVAQALAVAATGTIAGLAERLRPVPPAMAEVLTRALDPAPHRRGTAAELALDLRASLPPARLELTGGRIVRPAVRRQAGGLAAGGLDPGPIDRACVGAGLVELVPLESVPIDLTRIAPARPPTDVAAMLRAGAAGPDLSEAGPSARWARLPATGSRRLAHAARQSILRSASRLPRPASVSLRPAGRSARPIGRHRPAASATGGPPRPLAAGRQRRHRSPGRTVTGLLVTGLLVAGCVLGWSQWPRRPAAGSDRSAAQPRSAPPSTDAPAGDVQAGGARPAGGTAAAASQATDQARSDAGRLAGGESVTGARADHAGIKTAADAARVLAQLATVREEAYAERRPELLAGVYSSAALLAADTQQLYRSVPAGCGLTGVRADYRQLSLAEGGGPRSVLVTATASLPAAILSCRQAVRGRTRPTGPLRLRLLLADAGHGWRIVSERSG